MVLLKLHKLYDHYHQERGEESEREANSVQSCIDRITTNLDQRMGPD